MTIDPEKSEHFLRRAEESRPALFERICRPVGEVVPRQSSTAFQGWELKPSEEPLGFEVRVRKAGAFILDFGEHIVGTFTFSIIPVAKDKVVHVDAPLRVHLVFGEVPSEVCEPLDPFKGTLSRAWLQDEVFNDFPRENIVIERRLAFRYVKIEIARPSSTYNVRITDITCRAVSSAETAKLIPYQGPEEFREIDAIAVRTLANCMQVVFEDGPKRDCRLWLGDLRLQALANEVTFRNEGLVRRCLYLLAAFAPEDDLMRSDCCVYPTIHQGGCCILDYALLFAPTLLEYLRFSGDADTARELWPLAKFQIDFVLERFVDGRGVFVDPTAYWVFIDWRDKLDKEAAVHGILTYALGCLHELAKHLGVESKIPDALATREKLISGARKHLRDERTGFYVSGPDKQISYASHVWLIIAGVIPPDEGAKLLRKLQDEKAAVLPAGPYLYHYVIEAMLICGMESEALTLIRNYWGGMVKHGASTFWEVYDPEEPHLSPYNDHHLNSYCHAWSCTPSYFLRRLKQPGRG